MFFFIYNDGAYGKFGVKIKDKITLDTNKAHRFSLFYESLFKGTTTMRTELIISGIIL